MSLLCGSQSETTKDQLSGTTHYSPVAKNISKTKIKMILKPSTSTFLILRTSDSSPKNFLIKLFGCFCWVTTRRFGEPKKNGDSKLPPLLMDWEASMVPRPGQVCKRPSCRIRVLRALPNGDLVLYELARLVGNEGSFIPNIPASRG